MWLTWLDGDKKGSMKLTIWAKNQYPTISKRRSTHFVISSLLIYYLWPDSAQWVVDHLHPGLDLAVPRVVSVVQPDVSNPGENQRRQQDSWDVWAPVFFLFTCWFAATYSPWPAWHNKRRGIRHRSWKQRVHGQNRNKFQTIQKSLYVNSWSYFGHSVSEWSDWTWPRCPWREGMERETRRSRRWNWIFAINIQYMKYAICNMQAILYFVSRSIKLFVAPQFSDLLEVDHI